MCLSLCVCLVLGHHSLIWQWKCAWKINSLLKMFVRERVAHAMFVQKDVFARPNHPSRLKTSPLGKANQYASCVVLAGCWCYKRRRYLSATSQLAALQGSDKSRCEHVCIYLHPQNSLKHWISPRTYGVKSSFMGRLRVQVAVQEDERTRQRLDGIELASSGFTGSPMTHGWRNTGEQILFDLQMTFVSKRDVSWYRRGIPWLLL